MPRPKRPGIRPNGHGDDAMTGNVFAITDATGGRAARQPACPGVTTALERALNTNRRRHRPGAVIALEGSGRAVVHCVLSGWVSLSKSMPDGQRQIIDFALPGDILNAASGDMAAGAMQIEAVTFASVAEIPRRDWARLSREFPQLGAFEQRFLAEAFARLSERMLRLGKGSAETRIAHAILEFRQRLHAAGSGHDRALHLPLTQQQLGDFVGLS
ncbi:Crp/Fnr family transcriptional regulator [Aestuariicoccus sp. MJ-SS9]|uniref:Crp/Fnr family transcriptional regulator n=1 Tax=Aestuariicoccus sp. MJ-SS9 TaxID=3079855 RepID=UPI002909AA8D|nr:Crp/Fnr family transcriptional regulator [Aestuariicoccus sp. MJ-SS9]MDU8913381.1 Crp/Fnr family transcriptional regulator [Aestuariicoccus sp. MJ-SS9]